MVNSEATPAGRPRGRRAGGGDRRRAILDAARTRFAAHGFGGTTLRAVAGDAGVDPALVLHFFGSKRDLFAAAVRPPVPFARIVEAALDGPREEAGARVADLALGVLGDPAARDAMLALLRAASADPEAAAVLRDLLADEVYGPIAAGLGVPDAPLRAALVGSQVVGLAVTRHVIGLPPLPATSPEVLRAVLAPVLQGHLTGPLPAEAPR
jgi:AcrR family transcriptional regulator